MPCFEVPPCAGRLLVRLDNRAVHKHVLKVRIIRQRIENAFKNAHLDFTHLHALHLNAAHFALRAKKNTKPGRLHSHPVDRTTGIICDQTVVPDGVTTSKDYPDKLRRIRHLDRATNKTLVFLTNDFVPPSQTIEDLYRPRWHVELFFKIK